MVKIYDGQCHPNQKTQPTSLWSLIDLWMLFWDQETLFPSTATIACSFQSQQIWSGVNKRVTNFTLTRHIGSLSVKFWCHDPILCKQLLEQLNDYFHESHDELSGHGYSVLSRRLSRHGILSNLHSALFKTFKPFIALYSKHTALPVYLVK